VVYERLAARIAKDGRMDWVAEEFEALLDPRLYDPPPEEAWRRLKVRSRDARFVAIVQARAAWREREARRRDLPRARIIRDDLLMEVAASRPRSAEELRSLERVNVDRESAAGIVATVAKALAIPKDQLPRLPEQVQLPRGIGPTVDLLRVLMKQRSEAEDVAQRLIATGSDLEAIAADDQAQVPALHGWRLDLFGRDALALKRGDLALTTGEGRVTLLARDGETWRPAS
jgi:ribonuclease D